MATALVVLAAAVASVGATTQRSGSAVGHSACATVPHALAATAVGERVDPGSSYPPDMFNILRTPNAPNPKAWFTCRWQGSDGPWFLTLSVGVWASAADASTAFAHYTVASPQFARRCRAVAQIKATTCFTTVRQKLIGGRTEPIGTELIVGHARVAFSLWLYSGGVTRAPNGKPLAERPAELIPIAKVVLARVRAT